VNPERLHDAQFPTNPHPVWAELRHNHPVYHDTVDDVWIVSRHQDVIEGFADAQRFSNRLYRKTLGRVFGTTLLELDGAEHVAQRKVVAPVFAPTRLERFEPLIERVVAGLLDDVAEKGSFDIVADISSRLPGTVIVALMGFDDRDVDLFHEWYEAMMRGLWNDPGLRRKGREAHAQLNEHVAPIVEERRGCPMDDLLSRLIERGVEDLPAFISVLLTAGGETTDKALANMWRNLLANPDQLAVVRNNPERFQDAFSETLRFSPSIVYLGREVVADTEWHGVEIPAGAELRLAVGSANRDESVFAEPDSFDIDRTDMHMGLEHRSAGYEDGPGHIAFGAGRHFCLGYALSRLEATTASRMILERFPNIAPAGDLPPIVVAGPSQTPSAVPVLV
jgi:pulcherriminic acid synthase